MYSETSLLWTPLGLEKCVLIRDVSSSHLYCRDLEIVPIDLFPPITNYDVIGLSSVSVENGLSTCIHDSRACFLSELETLMPPDLFPCCKFYLVPTDCVIIRGVL